MTGDTIMAHTLQFRILGRTGYAIFAMAAHTFLIKIGGVSPLVFMGVVARSTVHGNGLLKAFAVCKQTVLIAMHV